MRITETTIATITYPYGTTPSVYRARNVADRLCPMWLDVWESIDRPYYDHDCIAHLHASRVGAYLATLPDATMEIL